MMATLKTLKGSKFIEALVKAGVVPPLTTSVVIRADMGGYPVEIDAEYFPEQDKVSALDLLLKDKGAA